MRIRTLVAALLTVAALPLLAGGPTAASPVAGGERVIHNDANGDAAGSVDIARVTTSVFGRTDNRLRFKVAFARVQRSGDQTSIYFDLNRRNAGPELRLAGAVDSEYWLARVDGWNDQGRDVRCEYTRMYQERNGWVMTAEIDLDCLGSPRRVRFETRTTAARDGSTDWLDRARTFTTYETR